MDAYAWFLLVLLSLVFSAGPLLVAMAVARLCWKQVEPSPARGAISMLAVWLAVWFGYAAGRLSDLWVAPVAWFKFVTYPLQLASGYLANLVWGWGLDLDRATRGWRGGIDHLRDSPWSAEYVLWIAAAIGLALLVAFALRPLISSAWQQRMQRTLPARFRAVATNPWPETRVAWPANLVVLLLCLVPTIGVGAVAALYLRLRRPAILWPSTWIAALLSFGLAIRPWTMWLFYKTGVLSAIYKTGAFVAFSYATMLPGPALTIWLLMATIQPTPRSKARRRCYILLILLCLPSVVGRAWAYLWPLLYGDRPLL